MKYILIITILLGGCSYTKSEIDQRFNAMAQALANYPLIQERVLGEDLKIAKEKGCQMLDPKTKECIKQEPQK